MLRQQRVQLRAGAPERRKKPGHVTNARTCLRVFAESRTVSVTFRMNKPLKYGLLVTITGGSPTLSSWGNGIPMNWSEGHTWSTTVELPVGSKCEYKYVVKSSKPGEAAPEWQPGANMAFTPPEQAAECEVRDTWDGKASFSITKQYTAPPPPLSNVVPAPNSLSSTAQTAITAGATSSSSSSPGTQAAQQQAVIEQPSWMIRSVGPLPTATPPPSTTTTASSGTATHAAPAVGDHPGHGSHHFGSHDGRIHGSVDDIHLIERVSPVLSDQHAPPSPDAVSSRISIDLADDPESSEYLKDVEEASRQAIPTLNNVTNPPSLSRLHSLNISQSQDELAALPGVAGQNGWPGSNGHGVAGNASAQQTNGCGSLVEISDEVHSAFQSGDAVVFEAKAGHTRADVHSGYAPKSSATILTSSNGSRGLELAVRVIRAPRMRRVLLTPSGTAQSQLELLTVHELRNECKKRGMACSGSREDLLKRLRDAGLEW